MHPDLKKQQSMASSTNNQALREHIQQMHVHLHTRPLLLCYYTFDGHAHTGSPIFVLFLIILQEEKYNTIHV